ncbi:tellurite resistance/C4-dicarboxylate transporter family protein [Pseudorhodobacter sp.]|uniref:tellurite resistance/C4-dicarboxylate transporter family protein n=1 Tax=Pseudorhodobacter sp. TaxID=1934400 RepID=UPI00264786AF|nr:tellurite resistance/C4-dicarboxylate transporter family protein [Pseudorhodobacter sp.]MDN5786196.1 tellurite resistance/C4-dicarboxylate transporter family protein [Pseudorhodobacter sp.]
MSSEAPIKPTLTMHLLHPDLAMLSPAYFGMVMATGIVALAVHQIGLWSVAWFLYAVALLTYAVLWVLTVLRFLRYRAEFIADVIDYQRGPGFFTMVAATGVLGSASVILTGSKTTGFILWGIAILLWIGLTYTIFTVFMVKEEKPTLERGITGAWLLTVVATQSIAVLSALLSAPIEQSHRLDLNFMAVSMWLWGVMLYIWLMTLIFYRFTFSRLDPGDLTPPYWINMGAMAISTLAGSLLIQNAATAPFLNSILPFLKGITLLCWATGTWWIPMLMILGIWRHIYKRFPLSYDPLYWGAVFPLGMYAVCTFQMEQALQLISLDLLTKAFSWIAVAVWSLTFVGFMRSMHRRARIAP